MRNVILFIAMSLDGYIADRDGGVGWLNGQGDGGQVPDSYSEFVREIDTVLMGWNTYHQVVTELSPGEWVYGDFTTYVLTHREAESSENIRFTDEAPAALVRRLKEEPGKDIWVCGGASLVRQLMEEDLIDGYYISVIPTVLGDGIRLFPGGVGEIPLRLSRTRDYDGIVELVYERRKREGRTAG